MYRRNLLSRKGPFGWKGSLFGRPNPTDSAPAREAWSFDLRRGVRGLVGKLVPGLLTAFFAVARWQSGAAVSFSKGPYLQNVTESSIIICWESDAASDGSVEYWPEGSHDSLVISVDSAVRQEVLLAGLQPGTEYGYRVRIPPQGQGTFSAARFVTAPAEDAPFSFAVYGDSRESDASDTNHQTVADAIRAFKPAFVIHTGDLVSAGDADYRWHLFWRTVAPPDGEKSLAGNAPLYPAIGNHEYASLEGGYSDEAIASYQSYFVVPPNGLEGDHPEWVDRFYSFRYGPAFFIVLDANSDSDPQYNLGCGPISGSPDIHPGSPQYQWLISQLEKGRAESAFTFVCFHPAPYSSGPWGKGSSYKLRFLDDVFREYGVDAVFNSHDHFYERCQTYAEGYRIFYFVEGAGGAPRYNRAAGWDEPGSWMWDEANQTLYTKAFDNSTFSFINVEIVPLGKGAWRATFTAVRNTGETFDAVQIRRPWGQLAFGDSLTYTLEAVSGRTYQVEYSDDIAPPEWQPLGEPILADGPFIGIADQGTYTGLSPADNSVRHRFYRARALE